MIKAATSYLVLILLCGSPVRLAAQSSAYSAAGEEAVRRQADTIQLRRLLADARTARTSGDLAAAARKYEEALALVQRVGVGIDRERDETISGFVAVRLELAQKAQKRGDLAEADAQITRAHRVDPNNAAVEKFKLDNDRRIADQQGKVASREEKARIPEIRGERIKTLTLVQDARLLMEMGKLDEAEAKLKQATKEDPENQGAFYYLKLLKERRYQQEARKREIDSSESLVEVERSWEKPIQRDSLPAANPFARTNRVYSSTGRQLIYQKLDHIVLDEFGLPSEVPLSEVIKELYSEVKKRDPDKRGVNFLISSQMDRPTVLATAGAIDPLTGQPVAGAATDTPVVIEDFLVKMDPPLRNVRLEDVLKAIVVVAKPPANQSASTTLKYSVEDYAVVFTQRGAEIQELYSRTFKVDPNTFRQGLEGVSYSASPFLGLVQSQGGTTGGAGGAGGAGGQNGQTTGGGGPGGFFTFGGNSQTTGGGGGGAGGATTSGGTGITGVTQTNLMFNIQNEVRNFFIAAGVDFQTNAPGQQGFGLGGGLGGQPTPPRKTLFFNDRTGILLVRATLRDLDIIEEAVRALNMAPPEVTIEAKFAEISQTDSKSLGFDWLLGNTLLAGGAVGAQGGSAPSFAGSALKNSPANPSGVFPGEFGVPSAIANPLTDQLLTSNLRNSGNAAPVATISGILTDPQFRLVIRALEQRGGVDLLSAPKVTTLSGRQARISVEDTLTIIVGLGVQGLGGGGVGVPGVGGGVAAPGISR